MKRRPTWRAWATLSCPECGAPPTPAIKSCPRCGRANRLPHGGLDLLSDRLRAENEPFAESYRRLRRQERWADEDGLEDPDLGDGRLWRARRGAARRAVAILRAANLGERPLVADVGAGGGWVARMLPEADVVSVDLLEPRTLVAAARVRGDMRALPVRDGAFDALIYVAAAHYAPVGEVVAEGARVLRRGGLLVAVESPIFPDPASAERAAQRARSYFAAAGVAEVGTRYHPPVRDDLVEALGRSGMELVQLGRLHRNYGFWRMLFRSEAYPTLVARRA